MLRPCISYGAAVTDAPIEEHFKLLHDAGFQAIDFNIDLFLRPNEISSGEFCELFKKDIDSILEFFKPYKEAAKKYGIEITQTHAPYTLYVDGRDDINEICYEMLEKSIAVCSFFDCKYIVVHPLALSMKHGREYELKENIEYYKRCIPFAKKYNVVVCLENMFYSVGKHIIEAVCSDAHDVIYYIDTLNELAGQECFGFCFDLGHMTLLGKNIKENIKMIGSRIKIVHLHDNDGILDNHAMPFTYTRNWGQSLVTDWNGLIAGLKEIGYTSDIDFECGTGCCIPPIEMREAALKYVYAAGL